MRRLIFYVVLFFSFFFFFHYFPSVHKAWAAGEFTTSYEVIYDVSPLGATQVSQNIKLTNLTTNYYASEFSLSLGKIKVKDVSASDELGPLEVNTRYDSDITTIDVKFNQKIVGKGKTLHWRLSFNALELAQKNGQIWEVDIPKLASSEDIADYKVVLSVPVSFGPLAFIFPQPKEKKEGPNSGFSQTKNVYIFDKTQLTKSGVSASFGVKQVFSFQLNYHLSNTALVPIQTEIALPPDNNYQKVSYQELTPKPLDVRVDRDGNWLARYVLTGKQKLEVVARGFVEVYPRPTLKLDPLYQEKELALYTLSQPYWDVSSLELKKKAQELKTPEEIYNFVVDYLTYNQERLSQPSVTRLGGQGAYDNPKNAVCMEFTDLFISLARAAGIPAREINGYAYTQNERLKPLSLRFLGTDTLHAWPEYYDANQGWVQVDPTWGNTSGGLDYFSKLDFNHITFVRKGLSSQQPLPAGAYKLDSTQGNDIKIEFAQTLPEEKKQVELDLVLPRQSLAGLPVSGKVSIANLGNQALIDASLAIQSEGLTNLGAANYQLGILPPYASRKIDLNFQTKGFLQREKAKVIVDFGGQMQERQIDIQPVFVFAVFLVGGIVSLTILVLFFLFFLIRRLGKQPL